MRKTSITWCVVWGALLMILTLSGCKQKPDRQQWVGYTPPVYEDYTGIAENEQIEALEAEIEEFKAEKRRVPAGYYAELGLLYFGLGKNEQMRQRDRAENDPFSESTAYMNALMKNGQSRD